MIELQSELLIDLRDKINIKDCIKMNKEVLKKIIKKLNFDRINVLTEDKIEIEDNRIKILKDENELNIGKIKNNGIKYEKIIKIIIYFLIILILINLDNLMILIIIILLIIINENLKKIIGIFCKEKIILE